MGVLFILGLFRKFWKPSKTMKASLWLTDELSGSWKLGQSSVNLTARGYMAASLSDGSGPKSTARPIPWRPRAEAATS